MPPWVATLLITLSAIDSTPRPITQLVHTRWTRDEGAPTEIRALAETRDGYIWVGTLSGLVRFDGVRFVRFVPQGTDTMPADEIRKLLATDDGSLWIVWKSGRVGRLHNGRLTTWGAQDGLPVTFQLAESSSGTLVAGTASGISRFADGRWTDVSRELGFPARQAMAVWFDRGDTLWVETEDRMIYLPSGTRRFLDPGEPLKQEPARASFAQARDGSIWMAEFYRSAHTLRRVGERSASSEVRVGSVTLLIDRKGSLWIGSVGDGLRRVLDPGKIRGRSVLQFGPEAEQFTEKDGLLSDIVWALLEDREGNIWVGTTGGLESFREGAFARIVMPGGVRQRSVVVGRDNSVWTTALNLFGVFGIGPNGRDSLPTTWANPDLAQDPSGVLWTVHDGDVLRLQGGRFSPVPVGRSGARGLTSIVVDASGTAWVFDGEMGLFRLTSDGLVRAATLDTPPGSRTILFSDREGRIWVGQQSRVALYEQGRLRLFGPAQGLAIGQVHAFFEDSTGHVWVASGGGVRRFASDRFRRLPQQHQEVADRPVYGITADDGGALWLVTSNGVLRLPPGELDRAFADSTYTIRYRTFDRLDGLPGRITEWNVGPWMARGPDGRIWVAADSGVASVDPQNVLPRLSPRVLIEAARIDGREIVPSELASLPAGSRDLEIDYTATGSATPERTQFRYQLDGEDANWLDVGTRRRAYYTGLAPGAHRFRVMASNGDGVWNEAEAGAVWNFRVLPTWYQTLWFRVGLVFLIGGIGAAAAALVQRRRHVQSQAAFERQHRATMTERARIAQDLHDTLLQGFTGITIQLRAIQRVLSRRPNEGAAALETVLTSADSTLRDARNAIWDMRAVELDGRDLPEALEGAVRSVMAGASVAVDFTVRGDRRPVSPLVETTALRIGREAVANALKHADASKVEVRLEYAPRSLNLEVGDDGRGMMPGAAEVAASNGHLGIAGMRARAARAAGTMEIASGPGRGTTIRVSLPIDQ